MGWDEGCKEALLFGGRNDSGDLLGDTWLWTGTEVEAPAAIIRARRATGRSARVRPRDRWAVARGGFTSGANQEVWLWKFNEQDCSDGTWEHIIEADIPFALTGNCRGGSSAPPSSSRGQ